MKKLIVTLLLALSYNISSAQSGWGYVNYTSYKTHNGNGSQNQYSSFANNAAGFDAMFNTANSNTTITHTGQVTLAAMCDGSSTVPRWSSDYFGYKFEFWFVPQETGTYRFGINSDDASDLSVGGTMVATYYGGHGASAYQYGNINLVAGTRYQVIARMQEFGGGEAFLMRWSRPSAPNTYSYWTNEVTNIANEPTKKARMNFDFGSTLDETKFLVGSPLNSTGWVDITNSLDSNKIDDGKKGNIIAGGVEWSYVNIWNGTTTLYIDLRKFDANTQPSNVKAISILDCYDGPVTYQQTSTYWAHYTVPSALSKVTDGTSSFVGNIRNAGYNNWAFACEVSFDTLTKYKPQSVTMTTTNTLSTLYNSIVTVSDVYLAFKELANGGIFGNQTGNEFTYGIQYKNADINDDNVFDESDCFRLLQHLTGAKNIVDTFNLSKTLKLIPQTTYNTIGKSNWTTFSSYLGDVYNFDINTNKPIDTFYLSSTWKGDVNLSHSAIPASNGITTNSIVRLASTSISNEIQASIITEVIGDSVYAYITLDPSQQQLVGTQFQLNYDNSMLKFSNVVFKTKGNPTNYATNKGEYINVGSLISDGSTTLDNTTEYKVSFLMNTKLNNILGLISIGATDAVNKDGKQLKVTMN